mmetsp:Transcript_19638/g.75399  ORF Transcript_19638/g.75399 Transcript_19638/m.75399 type:complete len:237 (+) Transcript_19638:326-1036(+)
MRPMQRRHGTAPAPACEAAPPRLSPRLLCRPPHSSALPWTNWGGLSCSAMWQARLSRLGRRRAQTARRRPCRSCCWQRWPLGSPATWIRLRPPRRRTGPCMHSRCLQTPTSTPPLRREQTRTGTGRLHPRSPCIRTSWRLPCLSAWACQMPWLRRSTSEGPAERKGPRCCRWARASTLPCTVSGTSASSGRSGRVGCLGCSSPLASRGGLVWRGWCRQARRCGLRLRRRRRKRRGT